VRIEREAPRGFGYHTRLIASRDGEELPIAIVTASFRAATVVAICDPGLPLGIDIRDAHPEPADLRLMRKHSHLSTRTTSTCCALDQRAAVIEADGRGVRWLPSVSGWTRRVSRDGSATAT
jgi:4'-phosphopantetheinyl transferase